MYFPVLNSELGGQKEAPEEEEATTNALACEVHGDTEKVGWDAYATLAKCIEAEYEQRRATIPIKAGSSRAGQAMREEFFQCKEPQCQWLSRTKTEQQRHKRCQQL